MKSFVVYLLLLFALGLFLTVSFMSSYELHRTQKTPPAQKGSNLRFLQMLRASGLSLLSYLTVVSIVLPFAVGFFGMGINLLQVVINASVGPEAWTSQIVRLIDYHVQRNIFPAVFFSFIGVQVLRGYVVLKLRHRRLRRDTRAV